jgi:hypothetical protein
MQAREEAKGTAAPPGPEAIEIAALGWLADDADRVAFLTMRPPRCETGRDAADIIPGANNQLFSRRDLGRIAFGPVVIEPGLAGGNHFGRLRQSHERLDIRLERVGIVGMYTDRGIEVGMGLCQRQHSREILKGYRNAQGAVDRIDAHSVEDRVDLGAEFGKVEVAVRIDVQGEDSRPRIGRQKPAILPAL